MRSSLLIMLALIFSLTLVSGASAQAEHQQKNENDEVIKVDTTLINIPAVVKRKKGNGPAILEANNFELFEDGVKQEISLFNAEDSPASIIILITSTGNKNIQFAQAAAAQFIKVIGEKDRVKLVSFSDKVTTLADFTSDKQTLFNALVNIKAGGQCRLGDVLYDTALEMKQIKGRKVILLLSDGYSISSYPQKEILNELAESGAIAYSVHYPCICTPVEIPTDRSNRPSSSETYPPLMQQFVSPKSNFVNNKKADPAPATNNRDNKNKKDYYAENDFLIDIAESTGGQYFNGIISDLPEFMNRILEDINSLYTLGYYPSNPIQNGGFRKIKLSLSKPIKASLRYKKGYNANLKSNQLRASGL